MKTYKERTQSILQKAEVQRKKRTRIKIISVLSCVAAAIVAFNLVLFVPYTVGDVNLSKYKSSEYYGVIKQLYGLTYSPQKTNNFDKWFGHLFAVGASAPGGKDFDASGAMSPLSPSSPSAANDYRETTLNQTDGVTEGDLFKRSDAHIFYLGADNASGKTLYSLRVFSVAGDDSALVAEYEILPENGTTFSGYIAEREMYLSEDLGTITVISPCYDAAVSKLYTTVINIDVSDLSDVQETDRTYISGKYVSSRVADGNLIVISDFTVPYNVNFDDVSAYVPHVGKRGKMRPLAAKDIVCPSNADDARYTVVCSLTGDLTVADSVALMSFSDDVYVSQNNLFATRSYDKTVKTNDRYDLTYTHDMTEIRIVPYDNGKFGNTRAVNAAGSVLNRYSLDEYNGKLRAATTVRFSYTSYTYDGGDPYAGIFKSRCMLYCFDLDTLQVSAKVTNFAPAGESVKSARFYGDTAYVCTAEVNYSVGTITDPVFAFDLSDLNNITYRDTGTIPGYSLSLNRFSDNTLLGIGYGDSPTTLKIELYEQTDSDVRSVAKYEEINVSFSSEFKAHLIDAKNGIIGLGISTRFQNTVRYALFRYDGYELIEISSVPTQTLDTDRMRATVIDGYAYVFEDDGDNTNKGLHVLKIA